MLYPPPRGLKKSRGTEIRLDGPGNPDLAAHLLHRFHDWGCERNPFPPVFLHPCKALLTVHIDPVLTLRLRRVLQLTRQTIHVRLELVQGTKRSGINRHEKMPHIRLRLVNIHTKTRRRAAQDPAEHIHHQSQPVALMPRMLLPLAAQRQDPTTKPSRQCVENHVRIRSSPPRRINSPARGHSLLQTIINLQFSPRHHGGCHVQDERLLLRGGRSETDRIGPQNRGPAKSRDNERCSVGHADPYQIVLQRHQTIVAGNSVMVRVSHRNDAYRRLLGLSYRQLHSSAPNDLAQALAAVDHCSRLCLPEDPTLVCGLCPAVL